MKNERGTRNNVAFSAFLFFFNGVYSCTVIRLTSTPYILDAFSVTVYVCCDSTSASLNAFFHSIHETSSCVKEEKKKKILVLNVFVYSQKTYEQH